MPCSNVDTEDGEWQIIGDWWRTSSGSVSWSYPHPLPRKRPARKRPRGSNSFARPPHYHETLHGDHVLADGLANTPSKASFADHRLDTEDRPFFVQDKDSGLDAGHIGVKGAEEVMRWYERDVGFHDPTSVGWVKEAPDGPTSDGAANICSGTSKAGVEVHTELWDQLMLSLFGGKMEDRMALSELGRSAEYRPSAFNPFSDDSDTKTIERSISRLDSLGHAKSNSLSLPPTPKPRSSYAKVVVKKPSSRREPRSHNSSPAGASYKALNASASVFVPTSPPHATSESSFMSFHSPSPPPPKSNPTHAPYFTFPSLNIPSAPIVKIQKDDQGFYCGIEDTPTFPSPSPSPQPNTRPSSSLLPPFLQDPSYRRKASPSRTRAIVDGLRSSPNASSDGAAYKARSSVSENGGDCDSLISGHSAEDDDDGGWIGSSDPQYGGSATSGTKTRRTRELFHALTRRRSNSSPSDSSKDSIPTSEGGNDGVVVISSLPLASSASPSPSISTQFSNDDGWIEGPPASPPPHVKPYKPRALAPSAHTSYAKKQIPLSHLSTPHYYVAPGLVPSVPAARRYPPIHAIAPTPSANHHFGLPPPNYYPVLMSTPGHPALQGYMPMPGHQPYAPPRPAAHTRDPHPPGIIPMHKAHHNFPTQKRQRTGGARHKVPASNPASGRTLHS